MTIARTEGGQGPERRHPDWERLYAAVPVASLPWHNPLLDQDVLDELERRGLARGRLLDVGTGSGTQARALARRGFTVTATDVAATAIAVAEGEEPHPGVEFVVDDIVASRLEGPFDLALDLGCLHVLEPGDRGRYVEALTRLLVPGGLLFLKCFSRDEPDAGFGPLSLDVAELEELLGQAFTIRSLRRTRFEGPRAHKPKGLFAVCERKGGLA